jgi:hypothetical protein
MFVFLAFSKSGLIELVNPLNMSAYKIAWPHGDWCKFYVHLRSLNVSHFGMVEAKRLKIWCQGHLQWHDVPTKFLKIHQLVQNLIGGGDRHTEGR